MTLPGLTKEYRDQAAICSAANYSDKGSVKASNAAADRMRRIADIIASDFGADGLREFASLLDDTENDTNIWAATHLLERMKADAATEDKALEIIKNAASEDSPRGLGFQYWLKSQNREFGQLS